MRFKVLHYIKDHSITISHEIYDEYYRDYVNFCIHFELELCELAAKYGADNGATGITLDFINNILEWTESKQDETEN